MPTELQYDGENMYYVATTTSDQNYAATTIIDRDVSEITIPAFTFRPTYDAFDALFVTAGALAGALAGAFGGGQGETLSSEEMSDCDLIMPAEPLDQLDEFLDSFERR